MTLGRLQRSRRKVIGVKPYRAILGDGVGVNGGNVYAGEGYYWVRPYAAANVNNFSTPGTPYRVRVGSALVMPRAGFVVWIGPGLDNRLTVIGYDHDDMILKGIDPAGLQPNDPYRQWIRLKDIQNFRALPIATGTSPSLLVSVRQLFYYTDTGDLVRWNGTNADTHIDLAPYVPASGFQCYVVLWLRTYNPNGLSTIQVTYSDHISSADGTLSFTELQQCADASDADTIPIGAFRLANAQTTLKIDDTVDVDLRQFINMPQVWGFPNTIDRAYRLHEYFSALIPSALIIESGGVLQIQTSALLEVLGETVEGGGSTEGGMTSWTLAGTLGTPQSIGNADTATIAGGAGINATAGATDTVTVAIATGGIVDGMIASATIALDKIITGTPYAHLAYDENGDLQGDLILNTVNGELGETVTARAFVIEDDSDGLWYLADTTAGTPIMGQRRGVILGTGTLTAGNTVSIVVEGPVNGFTGLTDQAFMYASATPGVYTQTEPSPSLGGATILSAQWGWAVGTTSMYVYPYHPVRYMKRLSLADAATTTIVHHADAVVSTRRTSAAASANDIAILETSGGTQDTSRQLKGQSGAGATTTVDTAGATNAALGDSGGNEFRVAQSVVPTAGTLSGITFVMGASVGTPSGDVTVEIRTDNAGIPSSTILYTTTHTPTASSNNTVTIGGTPPFLDTSLIWIVLSVPAQATNSRYAVTYNTANPYASGAMKSDSSASLNTWTGTLTGTPDMRCTLTTSAVVLNDGLAQGVSHSSTATVSYVDLLLKRTGTRTGDLTAALYSSSAGLPNTVITNGTATVVNAATVTTSYSLIRFTFPTPPTITASTPYHIVLTTSDSASNSAYIEWGTDASSPPYANGQLALLNPTWGNASPAADGLFDLYGPTTTFSTEAPAGFWFSDKYDMVARFDNGSGSNPTTNTTFKNTSGATLDVTCIVEMP